MWRRLLFRDGLRPASPIVARILLATLAVAAVAVPLLLLYEPAAPRAEQPKHAPAGVSAAPGATPHAVDASASARQVPTLDPPEIENPPGPATSPRAPDQSSAAAPPAPIVERQLVQGGNLGAPASVPTSAPVAPPPPAPHRRLDRSREARDRAIAERGGTPQTEDAVEAGLAWLAAHQSPDGRWSRFDFGRQCPAGDECTGFAVARTEPPLDAGITGLCLLAFLGAGYTDREGPHQPVVRRAIDALLAMQQPDGGFEADPRMAGYNDSLATLALGEALALTQDERLRAPLARAAARLVASQQPLGGWDYLPMPGSGRNDTSISAWAVQALQTCATAGISVPPRTLIRASLHFDRAAQPDGRVWYSDAGSGYQLDKDMRPVYRFGPGMTACGLLCEQLLGWRGAEGLTARQASLLLSEPPSASRLRGKDVSQLHSEYYWYYGTAALFQQGGEAWTRWNASLRDAVLPLQARERGEAGRRKHDFGSWPPFGQNWGKWGRMGGRVYSTAICTLTLEIYYRHTPAYLSDEIFVTADDWFEYLRESPQSERRAIIDCAAQMRVEVAEPLLLRVLRWPDRDVALRCAVGLARLDNPLGLGLLQDAREALPVVARGEIDAAAQRAEQAAAAPPATGKLRVFDAATRMATLELPRCYAGMNVELVREGRAAASFRVIQRFTGRNVVLAEWIGAGALEPPPRAGDVVRPALNAGAGEAAQP